jgi:hypothetical protein
VSQALKVAPEKFKHSTLLSRARAYYRVGKYQRALADCFAVLSGPDPSLKVSANQLKGYAFWPLLPWSLCASTQTYPVHIAAVRV